MNQSPHIPPSTGRFVFDEDFFLKKMRNIANRFDLKPSYEATHSWYNDEVLWYEAVLTGKYNFELSFRDDMISITPIGLNIDNYCTFSYSFEFFDDDFSELKAHKYERKAHKSHFDRDFEYTAFTSDIMFDDLSDNEIFDIVEKVIEAFYGAKSMKYETTEADDDRESFVFYLDAPDYYGYTETIEIGNFKFILNKENEGTENI